ncbi:MAG: InlB B-repeat-containing protein [Lachnospiraceae bacterium]|nr:InlB B-repeat-containing protein [Lachnospiraceae bacterium]
MMKGKRIMTLILSGVMLLSGGQMTTLTAAAGEVGLLYETEGEEFCFNETRDLSLAEELGAEEISEPHEGATPTGIRFIPLTEKVYSGQPITYDAAEIGLFDYDHCRTLVLGTDYTVSYKNNRNAWQNGDPEKKAPTMTLKGIGNYSGTLQQMFLIHPYTISAGDAALSISERAYSLACTGKEQKPSPTIVRTVDGKSVKLVKNRDYELQYRPGVPQAAGDYELIISGTGNYTGTIVIPVTVENKKPIGKAVLHHFRASIPWRNGEEITQENSAISEDKRFYLTYPGSSEPLKEQKEEGAEGDYTVTYRDNVQAGTATVTYTGVGSYTGTLVKTFRIAGTSISATRLQGFEKSLPYAFGAEVRQNGVTLLPKKGSAETPLREGTDYSVSYEKNRLAGTATVTYTGMGGYTGKLKKNFRITGFDLSTASGDALHITVNGGENVPYVKGGAIPEAEVKLTAPVPDADGHPVTQELVLEKGKDYRITCQNHRKTGAATVVITGMGNYAKIVKKPYTIIPQELSALEVTAADRVYRNKNGNFLTSVTVTDRNGKTLAAGKDFDNRNASYFYAKKNGDIWEKDESRPLSARDTVSVEEGGTVLWTEVTAKAGSYYTGTAGCAFRVVKADIAGTKVRVDTQYYEGTPATPSGRQVVVRDVKVLKEGRDYRIAGWSNNARKGTGRLILEGIGNYGGRKTVPFVIADRTVNAAVVYYGNGATAGSMKRQILADGKGSLLANKFTRIGYTFSGWNTAEDGSGTAFRDGASVTAESMLALYAQWNPVEYTITYVLNGGVNAAGNPDRYTAESETITLLDPTKEGDDLFDGWYTDKACTKARRIYEIEQGSSGNLTIYAKWKPVVVRRIVAPDPETCFNVLDAPFQAKPGDGADDSAAIQRAIDQAAEEPEGGRRTVYVPAGVYDIEPVDIDRQNPNIMLKSNVTLLLDNDAELKIHKTNIKSYCAISIRFADHATVRGGRITGERHERTGGKAAEDGHGVKICGSKDVTVSDMVIDGCWGDGIYAGTAVLYSTPMGCEDITIEHCEILNSHRNNLGIVDVNGMVVDRCLIHNAYGATLGQQCEIDVEPNAGASVNSVNFPCRNIRFTNTTVTAHEADDWRYSVFYTHKNPNKEGTPSGQNIRFENCRLYGYFNNDNGRNVTCDENTVIVGTKHGL